MVGEGTPEDPFYFADQDALNAILASSLVRPDEVRALSHRLAPHPPFPGVEIVDEERLVVTGGGDGPFALHHIQRKPWLSACRVDGVLAAAAPPVAGRRSRDPARAAPRPATVPARVDRFGGHRVRIGSGGGRARSGGIRRRLAATTPAPPRRSAASRTPTVSGSASTSSPPWRRTLADVRAHQLGSFACGVLRNLGLPVPGPLAEHELGALAAVHGAEPMLRAARDAYDGRLVLMKGYEVSLRYPEPWLRPFTTSISSPRTRRRLSKRSARPVSSRSATLRSSAGSTISGRCGSPARHS